MGKEYYFPSNTFINETIHSNEILIEILKRERIKLAKFEYDLWCCPTCLKILKDKEKEFNYCPYCGQHLYYP